MEKTITSFSRDHNNMTPGLYLQEVCLGVQIWDLRFKFPNGGDYVNPAAMHTLEHLVAVCLKADEEIGGKVVSVNGMFCQTGMYVETIGIPEDTFKARLIAVLEEILKVQTIPGATKKECGNYLSHDLASAKRELEQYLEILRAENA